MFNFNECKNAASVKARVREIAFSNLYEFACEKYGTDNVSIVNNNELAICVGVRTLTDGTEGEVCYTVKPVAKDFDIRITESGKHFLPYERLSEADAYKISKTEKEKEAERKQKEREEKKERDRKAREKAKAEKKTNAAKVGGITQAK